jgi:hypothetical protein
VVVVGSVVLEVVLDEPPLSAASTARATPSPMTAAISTASTVFSPLLIPPGGWP